MPPCAGSPARSPSGAASSPTTSSSEAYAAGLSDADLLQLVAECTFAGLVGTIDHLAGRVELDPFLQPRQWKAG